MGSYMSTTPEPAEPVGVASPVSTCSTTKSQGHVLTSPESSLCNSNGKHINFETARRLMFRRLKFQNGGMNNEQESRRWKKVEAILKNDSALMVDTFYCEAAG